jgi:hypothetical protein
MLEDIRTEKAEKYKELMLKKGTPEYDEWFLKYNPNDKRKRTMGKPMKSVNMEIILSPDAMREKKQNKKTVSKKFKKNIKRKTSYKKPKPEKQFLF